MRDLLAERKEPMIMLNDCYDEGLDDGGFDDGHDDGTCDGDSEDEDDDDDVIQPSSTRPNQMHTVIQHSF